MYPHAHNASDTSGSGPAPATFKNMKGDTDRANLAISDSGDTNGEHTAI
jgi:hypothetical protein